MELISQEPDKKEHDLLIPWGQEWETFSSLPLNQLYISIQLKYVYTLPGSPDQVPTYTSWPEFTPSTCQVHPTRHAASLGSIARAYLVCTWMPCRTWWHTQWHGWIHLDFYLTYVHPLFILLESIIEVHDHDWKNRTSLLIRIHASCGVSAGFTTQMKSKYMINVLIEWVLYVYLQSCDMWVCCVPMIWGKVLWNLSLCSCRGTRCQWDPPKHWVMPCPYCPSARKQQTCSHPADIFRNIELYTWYMLMVTQLSVFYEFGGYPVLVDNIMPM